MCLLKNKQSLGIIGKNICKINIKGNIKHCDNYFYLDQFGCKLVIHKNEYGCFRRLMALTPCCLNLGGI